MSLLKKNITKLLLSVFIILILIDESIAQSLVIPSQMSTIPQPATTAPIPGATPVVPGQTLITDSSRDIPIEFELKSKLIDISIISGYTFLSGQQSMYLGFLSGVYLDTYLEIGGKFSFESLKTYNYIFDAGIFTRVNFIKKGDTIPFFHAEASYLFGKKLKGFAVRPGFGVLQRIKGIFNIHLSVLCDLYFFTYRFNSEGTNVNTNEQVFSKFHIDVRLIFGLTFLID